MNAALTKFRRATPLGGRCAPRGRAFTLAELMVVIGIIAILASLGLVVAGQAIGSAKRSAATSLLRSIGTGLEAFKADFGDYPPLITKLEDYGALGPSSVASPEVWAKHQSLAETTPSARRREERDVTKQEYASARFMSEWSAAIYLLGVGDINGDDVEDDELDDGLAGMGIRHPGETFLAWKKVEGDEVVHSPQTTGRTYGPYMEPGSDKFLERQEVYYGPDDRIVPYMNGQVMYRFVDPWGNPIRYYRNWHTHDPADPEGDAAVDFAPIELRTFEGLERQFESSTATTGSLEFDGDLMRAPYMLLSAGDGSGDHYYDDGDVHYVSPFGDIVPKKDRTDAYRLQDGAAAFDAAFDPFGVFANPDERSVFMRMIKSNVRVTP